MKFFSQGSFLRTHSIVYWVLITHLEDITLSFCLDVIGLITDRTEDSEFEAESLRSVRIYLQNREDKTVHMNDIMKEFPQISKVPVFLVFSCFICSSTAS